MLAVQHNRGDKMHKIRFCHVSERSLLLQFIDDNWKKNHIFTQDTALLDWQHLDKIHKRYNFVVAYNEKTDEFDAILGFIPTYQFDNSLEKHNELWLAIWKIKDNVQVSGLQLLFYLKTKLKPKLISSIGITENVRGIYDALKFKRGILNQFYILPKEYISCISNIKNIPKLVTIKNNYALRDIDFHQYIKSIQSVIESVECSMHKSLDYIENKFLAHPYYTYKLIGVFRDDTMVSLFIVRKILLGSNSCLRIVDYYGPFIKQSLYSEFINLLKVEESEYIDFLCYLEDYSMVTNMGFILKSEDDIIPEYFEPYIQKNIDIEFAYSSRKNNIRIFKADSDQDRPSLYKGDNQ